MGFFQRQGTGLRSLIRSRREAVLLLGIPVVLLINLALLAGFQGWIKSAAAASKPLPYNASLTCPQVFRLARWSETRFAKPALIDFSSSSFSKRVMKRFTSRLDPLKVLFTKPELNAYLQQAEKAWKNAQAGDCGIYDRIHSTLTSRRSAHENRLAHLTLPPSKTDNEADENEGNELVRQFKEPAASEAEIKQRLETLSSLILGRADQSILKAYQNNRRQLVADSFREIMFEEESSNNLLAKAVLASIDPYSTYLDSDEFEEFYQDLIGSTSGIGVRLRKVTKGMLVIKLLKDTPASKSKKISVGDTIIAVDGKNVSSLSTREAKRLIKGKEASPITLDLLSGTSKKNFQVRLIRQSFSYEESRITHRSIKGPVTNGKRVAVIEIPSFYGRGGIDVSSEERSSSEDLERIVSQLTRGKKAPSAIVLDLRGNPGGFLEEAVSMAGLFLGDRPVVGVVEQTGRRVLKDSRAPLYRGPLVVLMDQGSASASEVLAGALKDHQRAIVLGDGPSFGKGTVQRLFHLQDELALLDAGAQNWNGVVKLTTSVFYSPLGHTPANGGVTPHFVLASSEDGEKKYGLAQDDDFKVKLPEVEPFLDSADIETLKHMKTSFETKVALLEKQYQSRHRDHDMAEQETSDIVEEAAHIAADYTTSMEQEEKTLRVTKSSAENSPIRNVRRDMIGY